MTTHIAQYLTFGTKSGHFGPFDDIFGGQKADFGTMWGPKGYVLLIKWLFESPLKDPNRPEMGQ